MWVKKQKVLNLEKRISELENALIDLYQLSNYDQNPIESNRKTFIKNDDFLTIYKNIKLPHIDIK